MSDAPVGRIENVRLHSITADAEAGCVIYASDDGLIRNVAIDGLKLTLHGSALENDYGGNLDLRPALDPALRIFKHDLPAILAHRAEQLQLKDVDVQWHDDVPKFFVREKTAIER
jgi:hypothetical protein